jgi:ferritin
MNEQIKHELESYYIYLSMAAYFHSQNMDGMAQWMRAQAHEEMIHAMKFFDHIIDRGGQVTLQDLSQHKTSWTSLGEAWEDAYKHEQFISGKIKDIMKVVREEGDYSAEPLVSWFVEEQIEEEANSSKILEQIKQVGDAGHGKFMLDHALGGRPFPSGSPIDRSAYSKES